MAGADDVNRPPRKRRMLTEEQISLRRERDRRAKRAARARETPEQTENRRRADREAKRAARARETPDEIYLRREANNQAKRSARAQETPDQSRRRQESVNDATAVRRRIAPAAPSPASAVAYVDFGIWMSSAKLSRAPIHGRTKGRKFRGQSNFI